MEKRRIRYTVGLLFIAFITGALPGMANTPRIVPLEMFDPYKEQNAEINEEAGCVLLDAKPLGDVGSQLLLVSFDYGLIDPNSRTPSKSPPHGVKIFVKVDGKVRSIAAIYEPVKRILSFRVQDYSIRMAHDNFRPLSQREDNEAWAASGWIEAYKIGEESTGSKQARSKFKVEIGMGC